MFAKIAENLTLNILSSKVIKTVLLIRCMEIKSLGGPISCWSTMSNIQYANLCIAHASTSGPQLHHMNPKSMIF